MLEITIADNNLDNKVSLAEGLKIGYHITYPSKEECNIKPLEEIYGKLGAVKVFNMILMRIPYLIGMHLNDKEIVNGWKLAVEQNEIVVKYTILK